ncbi:hypothetical protein GF391_00380 [Candidatus Uhrbacteria bacterium]|nr:hypothetical protein [Candidatus Uhrbacteria bacterium]
MEHLPYSPGVPPLPRKSELPPATEIDTDLLAGSIEDHLRQSAVGEKAMLLDDLYYMCADELAQNPKFREYDIEDMMKLMRAHGVFEFEADEPGIARVNFLGLPVLSITIDESRPLPIELDIFDKAQFKQQLEILLETLPSILDTEEKKIRHEHAQQKNPLRNIRL